MEGCLGGVEDLVKDGFWPEIDVLATAHLYLGGQSKARCPT